MTDNQSKTTKISQVKRRQIFAGNSIFTFKLANWFFSLSAATLLGLFITLLVINFFSKFNYSIFQILFFSILLVFLINVTFPVSCYFLAIKNLQLKQQDRVIELATKNNVNKDLNNQKFIYVDHRHRLYPELLVDQATLPFFFNEKIARINYDVFLQKSTFQPAFLTTFWGMHSLKDIISVNSQIPWLANFYFQLQLSHLVKPLLQFVGKNINQHNKKYLSKLHVSNLEYSQQMFHFDPTAEINYQLLSLLKKEVRHNLFGKKILVDYDFEGFTANRITVPTQQPITYLVAEPEKDIE